MKNEWQKEMFNNREYWGKIIAISNDKIIAVATNDPAVNYISDVDELPKHFIAVLKNYFENYKVLENKIVEIDEFQHKDAAYKVINEAIDYYKVKFPK